MPTSPVPEGRRSKRIASKKRASLVINLDRNQKRIPCLVVDAGERVGLIKFGSRVDVFLGPEWEVAVALGERVTAGSSVIARRKSA